MNKDIIIVAALEEESQGEFEKLGYHVMYTGIGKVDAALAVDRLYFNGRRKIINLGTCGSFNEELLGKVTQVTEVCDRDLPEKIGSRYVNMQHVDLRPEVMVSDYLVRCGTGDSFVTDKEFKDINYSQIFDMELYGIARACEIRMRQQREAIYSLKYVSDLGDEKEWSKSFQKSSVALAERAKLLIRNLLWL